MGQLAIVRLDGCIPIVVWRPFWLIVQVLALEPDGLCQAAWGRVRLFPIVTPPFKVMMRGTAETNTWTGSSFSAASAGAVATRMVANKGAGATEGFGGTWLESFEDTDNPWFEWKLNSAISAGGTIALTMAVCCVTLYSSSTFLQYWDTSEFRRLKKMKKLRHIPRRESYCDGNRSERRLSRDNMDTLDDCGPDDPSDPDRRGRRRRLTVDSDGDE